MKISLILVPILFLFCLSCIKEPKKAIVYGPEVSKFSVAKALQKALGTADSPMLIKNEEAVLRENTRFIRGRPVIDVLSTSEITVVSRKETSTQLQINDVEKLQNFDPGNPSNLPPPIIREDQKCWSLQTMERENCEVEFSLLNKNWDEGSSEFKALIPFSYFAQQAADPEKSITYHDLKVKNLLGTPPEPVVNSANCQGIPNCQINITEIEFDRVNWVDHPEGYKIHYTLKVSQDVPQMSRILSSCQQGSIQIIQPGQDAKTSPRYLVTFCDTVKNFLPGNALPK